MYPDDVAQWFANHRDGITAIHRHFFQTDNGRRGSAPRRVVHPSAVRRPGRAKTWVRKVAQVTAIRIHQPDTERQPLIAARCDETDRVSTRRPHRHAPGYLR